MSFTGESSQRKGPKNGPFWTFPENGPKMIPEKMSFTGESSQRKGPKNEPFLDLSLESEPIVLKQISSFTAGHHSLECNLVVPQGLIV